MPALMLVAEMALGHVSSATWHVLQGLQRVELPLHWHCRPACSCQVMGRAYPVCTDWLQVLSCGKLHCRVSSSAPDPQLAGHSCTC